jgi:HK97 family phage portal protein
VSKYSSAVLAALPLAAAEFEALKARDATLAGAQRTLRASQRTPAGDWRTWLILAGRGWGKTLTGAEDVKTYGLSHPGSRIAIVAPTLASARDTCIEGQSGLISVLPRGAIRVWNRSLGELILTNETRYKLFSAEEPDRLRGPQHHRAWCDELASWGEGTKERDWPAAWDMLMFGLRLGADPRCVVTTTPRPTRIVKHLVSEETVTMTRGHSDENAENLPPAFLDQIMARYEGTRLGRQELDAEILEDVPGALWTWAMLEDRRPAPDLTRVVVAIDPAVTSSEDSDETGIVVCGLGVDGRGYVLADRSCRLSPDGWARRAVAVFDDHRADLVVAEVNNGGDLVENTLRTVRRTIPYRKVTASRGKQTRAQPVAALYEQGRVSHVVVFDPGGRLMGLFDWLGPTSLTKRRGWDALPAPVAETKANWLIDDYRAVIVSPLIHGPGATEILNGYRGSDGNSAVFACLNAIATAIAEPALKQYKLVAGERVEQDAAPILELFARPNDFMTLDMLLAYVSNCLHVDGNAYWRKIRAGNEMTGNVVQLWPISPTRIEVRTNRDSGDFISAYRYYLRPGRYEDVPPENMVHFRAGLDDRDHRLGCSALKRLTREVSSDEQATKYADRLLANFATPGLSVVFPPDASALTQAQADEIKAKIQSQYSGDNVGAVSVMSPGAKLEAHGFSPEQMDLKVLHRVPEERIAAVLGVPAIVAGLGAGLDRSTYANFKEAREAFTEMKLLPFWRSLAAAISLQLLADFTSDRSMVVEFDVSEVRALADDENAKADRLVKLVAGGILDTNEARAEIGREARALVPASDPADADAPGGALPATRSRPRILTLPSRKAASDLPGHYDRLKDDRLPDWEGEMRTFLEQQQRRMQARLRTGIDDADSLIAETEATLLGETLTPLQLRALDDVARLVIAELGIEFQLDDPATRAYLLDAGQNVVAITDTTREAVRDALIAGQQAGEGIDKLARRLRELPAFNDARARTVARTELAHSTTTAALANYRASGVVVGCRVFDGDYDGACAAMNGRTFPLNQLPPTLQHPNCRRAFAPIVDSSELTASA